MTPETLHSELKKGVIRPFYFLYGEEDFLKAESFARIKDSVLQGGLADFNMDQFSCGETDVSRVLSAASTLPVMSKRRLVILRSADKLKADDQELLLSYLQDPSPSSTLLMVGASADKRKKFFSFMDKAGSLVEHKHPSEGEMPKWIRWIAKKKSTDISDEAARYLAEVVGNDLTAISGEIDKLSSFASAGRRIEADDVEAVTVDVKAKTVFQLTDAMAAKDLKGSLMCLRKLIDAGESPILILSMIARQLRLIWIGLSMKKAGAEEGDIRKRIGLPPFVFKNYIRQLRSFSEDELSSAYERLFELDIKFKSSPIDKVKALELFLFQVCRPANLGLK